ncbi:molybdenum cofactor biosynthesis protein B [Demequina sp. NBRC 110056]|uniref:MogA/MoaB family molybdenum cofactor biosynthesis protein n=1 Tax=Demequina sp. NBRC 110056 TaxID=1570345 RepID=UPI001F1D2827|nr:molybdenum cofactor synthesis domain-containing protein [Demequina sp. NBRC 110056]
MADLTGVSVAVITVSDRRAAGEAEDTAGPAIAHSLASAGAVVTTWLVPDGLDSVRTALDAALADGARLVVTTGGTGVGPRDLTPEATRGVIDRDLPGVPELLRREGSTTTPAAALSRGRAGVTAGPHPAIVVNLPGSERAAREGVATLLTVLPHALSQLEGGDHA